MEKGLKRIPPYVVFSIVNSLRAVGRLVCEIGLKGINTTISCGVQFRIRCHVILPIIQYKLGDADIILVGAGEAPITPCTFALFCASGYLSRMQ